MLQNRNRDVCNEKKSLVWVLFCPEVFTPPDASQPRHLAVVRSRLATWCQLAVWPVNVASQQRHLVVGHVGVVATCLHHAIWRWVRSALRPTGSAALVRGSVVDAVSCSRDASSPRQLWSQSSHRQLMQLPQHVFHVKNKGATNQGF